MMTEKQKIFMAIGIAGVLWIAIIIGVVAHFVADDFTLEDLKNLRKQVEKQAEGVEECVPDCLMQQSEIEEKLGMPNGGQCFDECSINIHAGTEVCYERGCRYDKKIGRKMYGITVHYEKYRVPNPWIGKKSTIDGSVFQAKSEPVEVTYV